MKDLLSILFEYARKETKQFIFGLLFLILLFSFFYLLLIIGSHA